MAEFKILCGAHEDLDSYIDRLDRYVFSDITDGVEFGYLRATLKARLSEALRWLAESAQRQAVVAILSEDHEGVTPPGPEASR